jgi:hypothetical protein
MGNLQAADVDTVLLKDIATLPRAIRPTQDPWPQISRRISGSNPGEVSSKAAIFRRHGPVSWALAASVMLAAVSALLIMWEPGILEPSHTPVAATEGSVESPATEPAEFAVPLPDSFAEREYQAAFREFVRLDLSQSVVSSNTRDAMLQDWALMRQLEQDLLLAMEQEPDNALLQDRWVHLRASQLQLLHVIADAGQLPGRTLI